jgi:hypothetical protein
MNEDINVPAKKLVDARNKPIPIRVVNEFISRNNSNIATIETANDII